MLYKKLFPELKHYTWVELNLGKEIEEKLPFDVSPAINALWCQRWVEKATKVRGGDCSYGGYLEDRSNLWRGYYDMPEMHHLGIDYNVPEGTVVRMPVDGRLLLVETDPDQKGGWGGRLIFRVRDDLYLLLAHFGGIMVTSVGAMLKKGAYVGTVGDPDHNGNWYPHLHVQCLKTYDRCCDGYAAERYKDLEERFPNPEESLV
jgi:hypothetical protein